MDYDTALLQAENEAVKAELEALSRYPSREIRGVEKWWVSRLTEEMGEGPGRVLRQSCQCQCQPGVVPPTTTTSQLHPILTSAPNFSSIFRISTLCKTTHRCTPVSFRPSWALINRCKSLLPLSGFLSGFKFLPVP